MAAKKVLVADDELHIIHVVALKFRKNGYEVLTAQDGNELLELAKEEKPDILVTDYQMPGMTGIEAVEKLRDDEQTKNLPVIMLTARNFEFDRQASEKLDISEFVGKPFSPRELLQKVEEVLERRKVKTAN